MTESGRPSPPLARTPAPARERWSWALYDFANTIFSMNIVTLYFAVWIVTERGSSTTAYSVATSLSSVAVLFLAPWVGAAADASGRHKTWVVGLTLACVAATLAFAPLARAPLPAGTGLLLLLAAFALANAAYQLALPPYNAMLPELAPPSDRGRLSGIGTALGYVGSIAGELASAFRDAGRHRGLRRFVVASYFYQDALGTAISFMALYAVTVLGLPAGGEIRLFVTLTIPAVGGAALAGFACDRWGPRRTLAAVLAAWIAGLVAIALAPSLDGFWIGGCIVGLAFGGIWSAERPLLLTLVPAGESGRYFGLLALSARAAAIAGPLVWAAIVDGLSAPLGREVAYRLAVVSLAVMMAVALWLLRGVPDRPAAPEIHVA